MADSDVLRPFRRGPPPVAAQSQQRYQDDYLTQLQRSIDLLIQVVKGLEVRIAAGGL